MTAVPNALALVTVNTGTQIVSADHRNNYAAIQAAVNELIACLTGGTAAQVLTAIDGTDVGWGAASGSAVPPGALFDYAAAAAPTGYLLCDGAAVSRAANAALFAVIGTTYGVGDGSTTFNVPDFRGRVAVGYAASGGHTDVSTLGNNDGVAAANRRAKHNHTVSSVGFSDPNPGDVGATGGHVSALGTPAAGGGGNGAHVHVVGPGGTAAVDAPAYIVTNKIIKT